MKWNCYDLFDHYNTEKNGVPALKEQPIRTDAVLERVQAQTAAHSQPHKRSRIRMTKWAAGIAAAAVLVTGGTTLAGGCRCRRTGCLFSQSDRRGNAGKSGKAGGACRYAGCQL